MKPSMEILLLFPLLLLLFIQSEAVTKISTTVEMPLQRLSRAELAHIAGYGEERLSSVLVSGTIECGVCLSAGTRLVTFHVPGAKIAVACKTEGQKRRTNWAYGTTDEYGEFMIDLPSQLHANPKLEESCIIRILQIPSTSYCKIHSLNWHNMKLSSVGNGIRVYTAGTIKLSRPNNRCISKVNSKKSEEIL
ncbi:hypothetical protein LUZ60_005602 [Juncus effusus]|nr:hypothetical protein LUZ60_005602 [Juncus effusus]